MRSLVVVLIALLAAWGSPVAMAAETMDAPSKQAPSKAKPSKATPSKAKQPKATQSKAKAGAPAQATGYAQRSDVKAFIDKLVVEQGFDRAALTRVFSQVHYQPKIVALMQRPIVEPPKWFEYSPQFLSAARVNGGVQYWNDHAQELARAEATYGVPAEVIVAIIGVETFYGRNTGSHRVLDALSTLAFDYPRRASFFRGELEHFLILTRDLNVSPLTPRGSYAGAVGLPQFMPGSYRNFAVDFDADGHIDLWTSHPDIVGSVANYLARHEWQRGQPALLPAVLTPEARAAMPVRLEGGLSERKALSAWSAEGVTAPSLPANLASDTIGLLMLEEQRDGNDDASYWIALNNFYAITRYNRSRLYAAAVWQLSQAIRAARTTPVR